MQVRKGAAEAAFGLTGSADGKEILISVDAPARLARLVGDVDSVAAPAVKALVNLTDRANVASDVLQTRIIGKLMDSLRDEDCSHKHEIVMLLVNLTQLDEGCQALLSESSAVPGHHLRRLVQVLASSAAASSSSGASSSAAGASSSSKADPYEYVAHVVANMTRLKESREILLEPERRILPALFPQLSHRSDVRRKGIAATLRNCCFESEERYASYFLSPSVDLVNALLWPLAGPANYQAGETTGMAQRIAEADHTKFYEKDEATRRSLVEALLLLASNKSIREHMRAVKAYPVIKAFHEWLESDSNPCKVPSLDDLDGKLSDDDEATVESINKLVQQLYREDEVPATMPRDLKLVAPPIKTIAPNVDADTAASIARKVATGSAVEGMAESEVQALITPVTDWTEKW